MKFVGVDLETSGVNHQTSVPIQFGVAVDKSGAKAWDIGGWDWGLWEWNEESAKVHNIPKTRLQVAESRSIVDVKIVEYLTPLMKASERLCMVGWNIAGFDRPFIEKHLPGTFQLFSYRTVDLNAICFALAVPHVRSYDRIKRESKEYATGKLEGTEIAWHDAGFDALASLYSYEYLRKMAWQGINSELYETFLNE